MITSTYFLGANTPEGFRSQYEVLFRDRRIRRLIILKGGPGCGKSTLMRQLSTAAESKGMDSEQILCSSDPDSLDGLIVPQAGLALVDGTAPHVVEPPLCGLGAWYLDLGRFYRGEVLEENRAALLSAKEKNAACYPLCYLALRAAGAAQAQRRALAAAVLPQTLLEPTKKELLALPFLAPAQPGDRLARYDSALTPKGILAYTPRARKIYLLRDSCALAAPLLQALHDAWAAAGHSVIASYDPLDPEALQAVTLPEPGICVLRSDGLFPFACEAAPYLDLDAMVLQRMDAAQAQRLAAAEQLRSAAVQEALQYLRAAKQAHDALEAAYRPAVDFAGVTACAEELTQLL